MRGQFSGGHFLRGNCLRDNYLGSSHPGGNFLEAIIRREISSGAVVLEPRITIVF